MSEAKNIIIYNTADGKTSVSLLTNEGIVWMNQNQLAELFDASVPNISTHISNILKNRVLQTNSVIKDYLITTADCKQWTNRNLKEFMVKGFVVDEERLTARKYIPVLRFKSILERTGICRVLTAVS